MNYTRPKIWTPRSPGRLGDSSSSRPFFRLKVKSKFGGEGAWGDVVCAAEGGEKIIEGVLVGQIDRGQDETDLVALAAQQVVVSNGEIKQVSRLDARRILVVVLGPRRRNLHQARAQLAGSAAGERRRECGVRASASKSGLELLIGSEGREINRGRRIGRERSGAGDQPTVVAPVEAHPGSLFPGLILQVSCLVETFVMINAERDGCARGNRDRPGASDLRSEEARRDAGEDHERGKAVNLRHTYAAGESGNLGARPLDGEGNGSVAEHAEVITVMRVFPDVFPGKH